MTPDYAAILSRDLQSFIERSFYELNPQTELLWIHLRVPIGARDPSGGLVKALVNVTHDHRGRSKIPSHANMARCQRCELRATLSFLGQYVPRTGSSEPGPT